MTLKFPSAPDGQNLKAPWGRTNVYLLEYDIGLRFQGI